MSARFRVLIALAVVALALWVWRGLREHESPLERPVEAQRLPTSSASEPAQSAARTAPDGLACIPATPFATEKSEADWDADTPVIRGRLLASRDPEYQAAAALMAKPADRVALISPAWADSNIPVVAWAAARICAAAPDEKACSVDELVERLTVIDPLNSESWMFAAVRRLKRGDEARALAAVQRAAAAPESRIYWAETIALVERALAATSDYEFAERAAAAIGVAAANLPQYSDYTKMCATQSQLSQSWAYACLGYGELAERRGDTIMGESIARSMQMSALKRLGDQAKLAAVVARRDQAQAVFRDAGAYSDVDELIFSTPDLFADYLNVLSQQGESTALRWRHTEAARLRAKLPTCTPQ